MVTSSAEQLMVMAKVDAALQYETLRAHDRDNEESPKVLGHSLLQGCGSQLHRAEASFAPDRLQRSHPVGRLHGHHRRRRGRG